MTNRSRVALSILALDELWILLAFGVSYSIRYQDAPSAAPAFYIVVLISGAVAWGVLFRIMRLDGFESGWRMSTLAGRIALATTLTVACVLSIAYLNRLYYSRLLLGYFSCLLGIGFLLVRYAMYRFLCRQRRLSRKVVLVGNSTVVGEFAFKIARHPEMLYDVVGTLYPVLTPPSRREHLGEGDTTLGSLSVLELLHKNGIEELIVLEYTPGAEFQTFLAQCRGAGIRINLLPHGYELYTSKARLAEIDGLPLVSLDGPVTSSFTHTMKRAMDLAFTALFAVPALVIGGIAAFLLLRNNRPVFRKDARIGKDGRPFYMYRFDIDRDRDGGPAYEQWIRDYSISELPQLWNVVRGDMSLVGPRPEPLERVKHYSEWERERLKAVPGMTGLAQVNGLREHHSSEDKTRFDLRYLLRWSPLIDCWLLVVTLATIAKRCFRRPAVAEHPPIPMLRRVTAADTAPDN